MSKTFLEKHAAAMVCHRQEFTRDNSEMGHLDDFNALADYADELAAKVDEAEKTLAKAIVSSAIDEHLYGLPGGIAAR